MKALVLALVLVVAAPAHAEPIPTAREGASFMVPLYGSVIHAWDAPDDKPFAAGHRGIDVAAPTGTPVRASADGVVSFAGNVAGNLSVSIDHANAIRTTYSYLGSTVVKKNQHVHQGDVIGSVGHGHPESTGPTHVHLSFRKSDVYTDPLPYYVGSSYADLIALVE